jgi:RHS Repeat
MTTLHAGAHVRRRPGASECKYGLGICCSRYDTWDAGSNLATLTDPGGTVTYRYDDVNRLADLAEPGGSWRARYRLYVG